MTERRVSFAELDAPLRFRTAGAPLDATARELTYVRDDGAVSECRLTLELAPEAYARVDRECLFHLEPEARGAGAEGFAPDGPVRLEARLAAGLARALASERPEPAGAGRRLAELSEAGDEPPLLAAGSWYAVAVSAQVTNLPPELAGAGSLEAGYATTWAAAGSAPRLSMLAVLEEVLDEHGWSYEGLADDTGVRWRMGSGGGAWSVWALAREEEARLGVYSVLDAQVPADRRTDGAGLIARLNHGLAVGNWELDMDLGTLRYKTSIDVGGDRLSVALAARLIERNLTVVDTCVAALTAFAEGRAGAAEALARMAP